MLTIKRLILILLTVLAILFAGASLVESWKQPQIKVAWNYTKPISCSTRLSGNQKIVKTNLTNARNTLVGETLGSSNTAISRGTKVSSEEFEETSYQLEELRSIPFHSQTSVRLLYKRLPVSNSSNCCSSCLPAAHD